MARTERSRTRQRFTAQRTGKMTHRNVAEQPESMIHERFAGLAGRVKRVADDCASSATASRDRVISLIQNRLTVDFHPMAVTHAPRDHLIIKMR